MTEDESTRAHDIGEMYAVLPSIEVHPTVVGRLSRRCRRAPVGAYRSDAVEPMTATEVRPARRRGARSRRAAAVRRSPRGDEGPRHRAPPGSSAAGSSASCSSAATRSSRSTTSSAGDAANLAEFAGHPGLRPFEVGDVRDAGRLPALGGRGRRDRPPGRLDLGPGLDRRPGDDLRERRRRHVQPARGAPGRPAPGSCS